MAGSVIDFVQQELGWLFDIWWKCSVNTKTIRKQFPQSEHNQSQTKFMFNRVPKGLLLTSNHDLLTFMLPDICILHIQCGSSRRWLQKGSQSELTQISSQSQFATGVHKGNLQIPQLETVSKEHKLQKLCKLNDYLMGYALCRRPPTFAF